MHSPSTQPAQSAESSWINPPAEAQSFVEDVSIARKVSKEVDSALQAHVVRPPDNVYTPTSSPETLDVDGQKITLNVRKRKIKVGEKEHEVAETIVEPKNPQDIKETHIILGGYSVNTPHYYKNFIPFAVTGIRYIFINLLGGGTEEYVKKPKRISLVGGETSVNNDYLPQAAAQISSLIAEFNDTPISLEGYSMGGLVLAKSLARQDLLPETQLKRVNKVTLDAPVPTGALPFGVGSHLFGLVLRSVRHRFAGAFGIPDTMSGQFLGETMMAGLGKLMKDEDPDNRFAKAAKSLIDQTSTACFQATGVFPELVLEMGKDPLVELAENRNTRDHADLLSRIPISVIFRPGDKVISADKIQKMIERWVSAGYDARLLKSRYMPTSHMDLPGLGYIGTWQNGHGQAGRLSPKSTSLSPHIYPQASRFQGSPSPRQGLQSI